MLINDVDIRKIPVNFRGDNVPAHIDQSIFSSSLTGNQTFWLTITVLQNFPKRLFFFFTSKQREKIHFSSQFVYHKVGKQKKFFPKIYSDLEFKSIL